jgi:hypothetical protein
MGVIGGARTGRLPWGLAGMLAIVAAVETFLGQHDVVTTTHLVDSWTEAQARATSADVRESEILCLGDSQIQQGLRPRGLGVPAYNLAVQGGQPAASEALLRRALDAGARPRAIVVGFFPALLVSDVRINLRQWPEVLRPLGAVELGYTARNLDLGAKTLLGIALRSYRARAEIRSAVGTMARGEVNPETALVVRDRLSRRIHRGALELPASLGFADEVVQPGPPSVPKPWKPRREHDRSIRRLLALAEARGIAVYWVTTTLSPGALAVRNQLGLHAGYHDYLRRLQAEFRGMTVLDVDGMRFDVSAFHDACHLKGEGSERLTKAVAAAIEDRRGRWVGLEPAPGVSSVAAKQAGPTHR